MLSMRHSVNVKIIILSVIKTFVYFIASVVHAWFFIKPWYIYNIVSNVIQRYIESGIYRYHEEDAKSIVLGRAKYRSCIDSNGAHVRLEDLGLMVMMYIMGLVTSGLVFLTEVGSLFKWKIFINWMHRLYYRH